MKMLKDKLQNGRKYWRTTSDKQLVPKLHKEFIKFNNKEKNNPIRKQAKDMHRHFTEEDIKMTNKPHQPPGKCKLKLQ